MQTLTPKAFRNCGGHLCTLGSLYGGTIRCSHYNYRALQPFRSQGPREELANLAAALTDQRYDVHVRLRAASQHAYQGRLADTYRCDYADPLAVSHSQ
jgi:hypothetical protein